MNTEISLKAGQSQSGGQRHPGRPLNEVGTGITYFREDDDVDIRTIGRELGGHGGDDLIESIPRSLHTNIYTPG